MKVNKFSLSLAVLSIILLESLLNIPIHYPRLFTPIQFNVIFVIGVLGVIFNVYNSFENDKQELKGGNK